MEFIFEDQGRARNVNADLNDFHNANADFVTPGMSEFNNTISEDIVLSAPTIQEPKKKATHRTRRSITGAVDDIEIEPPVRRRKKSLTPTGGGGSPKRKPKRKTKNPWTWTKAGWALCGFLLLRLVFMDSGVVDFYKMENTLIEKRHNLELIKEENSQLIAEIHKIRTDAKYQKKITREHLGVLAQDEYLILFAKDSQENSI